MSLAADLVSAPRVRTRALDFRGDFIQEIPGGRATARVFSAATAVTLPSLNNLVLPEASVTILQPCLEQLGYSIGEGQIRDPFGGDALAFTLLRNHQSARYLLRFPPEDEQGLLQNPSQQNRRLVSGICERFVGEFGRGITLHVFHGKPPDGDSPHAAYALEMQQRWLKIYEVTTRFHGLSELDQLASVSQDALKQGVSTWLELQPLADGVQPAPAVPVKTPAEKMTGNDKVNLAEVLARHPSFSRVEDRKSLLEAAELGDVIVKADLEGGGPLHIANGLVMVWLSPPQLGKLIAAIAAHPEVRPEDGHFLNSLTERYSFEG